MKKYLLVMIVLAFGSMMCLPAGSLLAQEEEETKYSWGTVSSVSANQIVVREYDYDKDEEIEIAYSIDPKVELQNVDSLEGIAVGDTVDIDYVIRDDNRVAKVISIEKISEKEE